MRRGARTARRWPANRPSTGSNWASRSRRPITRSGTTRRRSKILPIDLFIEAHARPPRQIILDLDATDDPLHGHQEGRFFHGYYDCYCYLPLYIFCDRHLLAAKLRRSNIDASPTGQARGLKAHGAVEVVARIVGHLRARWPRVRILLAPMPGLPARS